VGEARKIDHYSLSSWGTSSKLGQLATPTAVCSTILFSTAVGLGDGHRPLTTTCRSYVARGVAGGRIDTGRLVRLFATKQRWRLFLSMLDAWDCLRKGDGRPEPGCSWFVTLDNAGAVRIVAFWSGAPLNFRPRFLFQSRRLYEAMTR